MLFAEWQEKHKEELTLPKRIQEMWRLHGRKEGKTCKRCKWLRRYQQGASWMKCGKSRITGGAGTDWRAGWAACGLFEEVVKEG